MVHIQVMINGKATAYVCENFSCGEPITELEKFKSIVYNANGKSSPL